jgi:hypothetical protein
MNIDSVNIDKNYLTKQTENQYRKTETTEKDAQTQQIKQRGDSLEISSAALNLANTRNRIKTGYYERPEIIQKTAEKLYNELHTKTQPTEKS